MTKKRLTRDLKWGFQYFPYHQLWMDNEIYTGWVAINYLTDGEYLYWDFSKAGKFPVAGKGMCWLTLIPDGKSRSITAMFTKDRTVSAWYVDVIDKVQIDEDGVVAISDVTTCDSAYKTKTEKIKVYLEKHPEIEKYAILDNCCSEDYSLDKEIKRHLVLIDEPKGLQDENCIQVCKLMNEITLKEIPHIDKT